jgi:predicted negative regulator of RcsB-dependent stress response
MKIKKGRFKIVGVVVMVILALFIIYGWKRAESHKKPVDQGGASVPILTPTSTSQANSAYIRPNLGNKGKGCSSCGGKK